MYHVHNQLLKIILSFLWGLLFFTLVFNLFWSGFSQFNDFSPHLVNEIYKIRFFARWTLKLYFSFKQTEQKMLFLFFFISIYFVVNLNVNKNILFLNSKLLNFEKKWKNNFFQFFRNKKIFASLKVYHCLQLLNYLLLSAFLTKYI